MKKKIQLIVYCLFLLTIKSSGQSLSINSNGSIADSSAILDVKSLNKGILIPRMTKAQKDAILNPSLGLLIFQSDNNLGFYYYNGSTWITLLNSEDKLNSNTLIYTTKGF